MKSLLITATFMLAGAASAQVIGTTKRISETGFCKLYNCQYVKVERDSSFETWTYYISKSINFDIYRGQGFDTNYAYLISARIIGRSPSMTDLNTLSALTKTAVGVTIPPSYFAKCKSKAEVTLFRTPGVEGYEFVKCRQIDSTEIQIDMGVYGV